MVPQETPQTQNRRDSNEGARLSPLFEHTSPSSGRSSVIVPVATYRKLVWQCRAKGKRPRQPETSDRDTRSSLRL